MPRSRPRRKKGIKLPRLRKYKGFALDRRMARDRSFIRKLVNNPMRYYLLNRLKYSSYVPLQNRVNLPVADDKYVSTSTQTVPVMDAERRAVRRVSKPSKPVKRSSVLTKAAKREMLRSPYRLRNLESRLKKLEDAKVPVPQIPFKLEEEE